MALRAVEEIGDPLDKQASREVNLELLAYHFNPTSNARFRLTPATFGLDCVPQISNYSSQSQALLFRSSDLYQ